VNFSNNISKSAFEKSLNNIAGKPTLVLIGKQLDEKERRIIRKASENSNVLFIELFNTPNHKSLARESGLKDSVLRFLTPSIFNSQLQNSATQFVLGNAAILKLLESVHFELKGTPSSTEKDLLEYSLINPVRDEKEDKNVSADFDFNTTADYKKYSSNFDPVLNEIEDRVNSFSKTIESFSDLLLTKSLKPLARYKNRYETNLQSDESEFKNTFELFSNLVNGKLPNIENLFLGQFIKHQPQYNFQTCFALSGSSRTALSLLGQHCGLNEVITFDWSWSYYFVIEN